MEKKRVDTWRQNARIILIVELEHSSLIVPSLFILVYCTVHYPWLRSSLNVLARICYAKMCRAQWVHLQLYFCARREYETCTIKKTLELGKLLRRWYQMQDEFFQPIIQPFLTFWFFWLMDRIRSIILFKFLYPGERPQTNRQTKNYCPLEL